MIQIQNTLDTYHYACDFNPIWKERLAGPLNEEQASAEAITRG
jgi:hypothetical protein